MTVGLIYPPRLRTSRDDSIPCDPAEFNTNNYLIVNDFQKSSSLPTRKAPRTSNKRHRRNVSFHNQVTVVEVERVPKSESKEVWWTFGEMDQFRSEAARSKERRRSGMKRCARTSNHTRKVLIQQCASEELDGIPSDPKILSIIACDSSKKARESAHRIAKKIEKEVESDVYLHERSNSFLSAQVPMEIVTEDRRLQGMSPFRWGAVVDAFTDTVTCGIASKVEY